MKMFNNYVWYIFCNKIKFPMSFKNISSLIVFDMENMKFSLMSKHIRLKHKLTSVLQKNQQTHRMLYYFNII